MATFILPNAQLSSFLTAATHYRTLVQAILDMSLFRDTKLPKTYLLTHTNSPRYRTYYIPPLAFAETAKRDKELGVCIVVVRGIDY